MTTSDRQQTSQTQQTDTYAKAAGGAPTPMLLIDTSPAMQPYRDQVQMLVTLLGQGDLAKSASGPSGIAAYDFGGQPLGAFGATSPRSAFDQISWGQQQGTLMKGWQRLQDDYTKHSGGGGAAHNLAAVIVTASAPTDLQNLQQVLQSSDGQYRCEVVCFGPQAAQAWQKLPQGQTNIHVIPVDDATNDVNAVYQKIVQDIGFGGVNR